jgi:hypothetical protein
MWRDMVKRWDNEGRQVSKQTPAPVRERALERCERFTRCG